MSVKKKLGIRGDTIIEVLIALAVISFALTVSFALSRSSLLKTRQAQERSEMLKLAQAQLEQLKVYIRNNPATAQGDFAGGAVPTFCFLSDGTKIPNATDTAPITSVEDNRCAANQNGQFDLDDGSLEADDQDRDRLFPYRAGVYYRRCNDTNQEVDEFYVVAGRYQLVGNAPGSNPDRLQVVSIMYRKNLENTLPPC